MKTKVLTMTLIAMFAIVAVTTAQNQKKSGELRGKRMEMKQGPRHNEKCFDKFFTEEQKEQIKAIRLKKQKKLKLLRDEVRELEAHQQSLVTADKPDMNAIYKNIDKISAAKNKIQKIKARQHQDIRSLLTEEQRMKFDGMKGHPMMKGKKGKKSGVPCGFSKGSSVSSEEENE